MLIGQLCASTLRPYVLFPRIDYLALYTPRLPSICVIGFTADHTFVRSSGIHFRPSDDDIGNLVSRLKRNQVSNVWIAPSQNRLRWRWNPPENPSKHPWGESTQAKQGMASASPGRVDAGGMAMAPRQPFNDEQLRPLKIPARMPLASVANLASVMDLHEDG